MPTFATVRLHIGKPVPCFGHHGSFCLGRPACLPKQRANTQVRPYNGFIESLQDILVHGFLTAQRPSGQSSPKKEKIKTIKVIKEKAKGQGERLGTAYRLEAGAMIYVPD